MLKSLDNSNGVQYYGGNDPSKMGGRIKKGGMAGGGSATASSAKRSAVGQRSSLESTFPAGVAANIRKQQAVLKDKNSTPEQRKVAQKFIGINSRQSTSRRVDSQGRKINEDVNSKGQVYLGQRTIVFGKASRARSARENS